MIRPRIANKARAELRKLLSVLREKCTHRPRRSRRLKTQRKQQMHEEEERGLCTKLQLYRRKPDKKAPKR